MIRRLFCRLGFHVALTWCDIQQDWHFSEVMPGRIWDWRLIWQPGRTWRGIRARVAWHEDEEVRTRDSGLCICKHCGWRGWPE